MKRNRKNRAEKTTREVWKERQQKGKGEKGEMTYIDRFISRLKYTECYIVIHS